VSDRRWRLLAGLAVLCEALAFVSAQDIGTTDFAWFRITAHLGAGGVLGVVLAALLGAAAAERLARRRLTRRTLTRGLAILAAAAVLIHLPFTDLPQGQPDTSSYFTYAQRFARAPLQTALDWPALAWQGREADFHRVFPLVPLVTGMAMAILGEAPWVCELVMAGWAVALPLSIAAAGARMGHPREGLWAGWLTLGVPFGLAQSGWLLVDVPLAALTAITWALLWGTRPLLALAGAAAALTAKVSAGLFLIGPFVMRLLGDTRRRLLLAPAGLLGLGALLLVRPPRMREDAGTWAEAALAVGLHLRPGLLVMALPALALGHRLHRLWAAVGAAIVAIVLYAPAAHAPRYAVPLIGALCLGASVGIARVPALGGALIGSGLALALGGYRPILVYHQAENLRAAVATLESSGVPAIGVYGDLPGTSLPAAVVAGLVDHAARVPVRLGGDLTPPAVDPKRHWWEFTTPPPWRLEPIRPEDGVLLLIDGTPRTAAIAAFGASPEGAARPLLATIDDYRGSGLLLPEVVAVFGPRSERSGGDDGMNPQ